MKTLAYLISEGFAILYYYHKDEQDDDGSDIGVELCMLRGAGGKQKIVLFADGICVDGVDHFYTPEFLKKYGIWASDRQEALDKIQFWRNDILATEREFICNIAQAIK